jgi:hypothetical protein
MNSKTVQLASVLLAIASSSALADDPPPRFTRDIQPLFKRHCVKCHGPAKREAKLNLSTPGGIIRGGMNGAVLIPHDALASLLYKRVSEDEMPPEEPLPEADKQLLRLWITAGAPGLPARESVIGLTDGKDHWAFQPLKMPELPPVRDATRISNPIDRFVQAALEDEELSIGPEADRATLLRRVSFDLTGLPPTREAITEFQNDRNPDAYARMVDRYLASPHYGERWGKYWLDAAGYADSNGYFNADSDRPLAWRYRDWVVRALNRDMPFDRFVREQLAGDELARFIPGNDATPETIELLEATHYLRNGQDGSGESDGNPDEVRADRYYAIESIIQNVTNSLFGLTIQCAKCHDHKFEPILQRDYYQMQAIFAPAFNLQQWVKPNERFVYASLPGEFAKWEAQIRALESELADLRAKATDWVRVHRPRGDILFADTFDSSGGGLSERWSNTAPGDNVPGGKVPVKIDSAEAPGLDIRDGRLRIIEGNTQGDSWVSTRASFDWTPDEIGAAIQVTFDLVADKLDESGKPAERIGYLIALHDFDDDSPVAGGNLLIDGHPGGATVAHLDYPGLDSKSLATIGASAYQPGRNYGVRITRLENDKCRLQHLVDFVPDGTAIQLAVADLPDGGFGFEYCCGRSFVVDNVVIERFSANAEAVAARDQFQKELAIQRQSLDEVQKKRSAIAERPGKIAWVGDLSETPPEVFLLERGDYAKPTVKVEPAGFAVLSDAGHSLEVRSPNTQAKTTGRRLAFAEWVTQPGSSSGALLARVQVNRIWQHHFGTGIVATPDNLGVAGASPSHPDLLEWLANEFSSGPTLPLCNSTTPPLNKGGQGGSSQPALPVLEAGNATPPNPPLLSGGAAPWSRKHLHRLILNSATYRQSSNEKDKSRTHDPDNRLLSRFPIRRLDAEAVRDALLAVSGDLDRGFAGPFVATKRNDSGEVVTADPAGAGRRRSVYLQQRRTQVVSFLAVFDAPTIVFNSVQRPTTTMPLQALALFNSEFVLERARSLAGRLQRSHTDESARVHSAYLLAWGREPDENELKIAEQFLEMQASEYQSQLDARARSWTDFCQMLLASNEFLYVE